jgi:hypothetical protein
MGALRVDRGVMFLRDIFVVLFNHSLTIISRDSLYELHLALSIRTCCWALVYFPRILQSFSIDRTHISANLRYLPKRMSEVEVDKR